MALPTTGLTAHYRADVTAGNLFKTFVGTGVHTGTPVDGDPVEVWDNAAGVSDQCLTFSANPATTSPVLKSTIPLMAHQCLDFDGTNRIHAYTQTAGAQKALSNYIANNLFTVIAAVYPQAIVTTNANVYNTEPLIADFGQFWGLFFRLVSGVPKIAGYNWDGSEDVISLTITTGVTWIIEYQHTGGNLKLAIIDEAGSKTQATNVPSGNTTNLTNQLSLGQIGGTFANFRIGEFAIWNTDLSTGTELADAEAYFQAAWPGGAVKSKFNALLVSP